MLSHLGRFDGVALLLDAGADRTHLEWTPLMEAVALGTLADVERALDAGAELDAQDYWSRTAWLLVLLKGDLEKAQLLLDRGANPDAVGRCGQPPTFYAIAAHHPHVLRWLLELGADPEQTDQFGTTPLVCAAEWGDVECARILLAVPVDVNGEARTTALEHAEGREVAMLLIETGADPQKISGEGRRAILGFPRDPDESLMTANELDYRRGRTPTFGRTNPDRMNQPFWESMIRAGLTGYGGRKFFGDEGSSRGAPIWSAHRFGQSLTFLPDGRIVQIAGEHEDSYDPDFCIYNDVFVHGTDGTITIYGYPREDFPPTDFHTATLVGDAIYVIGSLGYQDERHFGQTQVLRLDTTTFRIQRVETRGASPGWISRHRASLEGPREIRIWGGKISRLTEGQEQYENFPETWVLNLDDNRWRRG